LALVERLTITETRRRLVLIALQVEGHALLLVVPDKGEQQALAVAAILILQAVPAFLELV
jgi:hypothetical protein